MLKLTLYPLVGQCWRRWKKYWTCRKEMAHIYEILCTCEVISQITSYPIMPQGDPPSCTVRDESTAFFHQDLDRIKLHVNLQGKTSMELLNSSCTTHTSSGRFCCAWASKPIAPPPRLNQHGDHGRRNMSPRKKSGSLSVRACYFDGVMGDSLCFYASRRASRLRCCTADTGQLQLQATLGLPIAATMSTE